MLIDTTWTTSDNLAYVAMMNDIIGHKQDQFDYTNNMTYDECCQFLSDNNVNITTMSLTCNLNIIIDLDKFFTNASLDNDGILSIKRQTNTSHTHVDIKIKIDKDRHIGIRLHSNGALQVTGCKYIQDFHNATTILIDTLTNGNYTSNPTGITKSDIKFLLINANLDLGYAIDNTKFYRLLELCHVKYEIEFRKKSPCHASIHIMCPANDERPSSIFLFPSGSTIITSSSINHIVTAYHYIKYIESIFGNAIKIN